jgi:hypothetical protein
MRDTLEAKNTKMCRWRMRLGNKKAKQAVA